MDTDTLTQITQEEEDRTTWLVNLADFENPETLASYLTDYCDPTTYRIDGNNIYATNEALVLATEKLTEDAERSAHDADMMDDDDYAQD
jgi:hypothetical protein